MEKVTKREQLLSTARNLFLQHGFRRISIEEICRTAAVSKVTFYRYFRNKTDLIRVLLDTIFDEAMAQYHAIMQQPIPYETKIRRIIDMKLALSRGMGLVFYQDYFSYPEPDIRALIERRTRESLDVVLADFKRAQAAGDIRPDIKPEFILYFLNHLADFISDENLLALYNSPEAITAELTKFFFYGILARRHGRTDER